MPQIPFSPKGAVKEGPENPRIPISTRKEMTDQVTQNFFGLGALAMPTPIKQIATEWGFADATHFGKVFRRFQHVSPAAYRRSFGAGT